MDAESWVHDVLFTVEPAASNLSIKCRGRRIKSVFKSPCSATEEKKLVCFGRPLRRELLSLGFAVPETSLRAYAEAGAPGGVLRWEQPPRVDLALS